MLVGVPAAAPALAPAPLAPPARPLLDAPPRPVSAGLAPPVPASPLLALLTDPPLLFPETPTFAAPPPVLAELLLPQLVTLTITKGNTHQHQSAARSV